MSSNNCTTISGSSSSSSQQGGTMTLATTTFLKLNQSHFTHQGIDYVLTPSPSESSDYYQPPHPVPNSRHPQHTIPYHLVTPHHHLYPHAGHHQYSTTTSNSPMQHKSARHHHYGTVSSGTGGRGKYAQHHTYQSIGIGPSTISSKLHDDEHHYAKPDNMGNIEIIKSKHLRTYDEMNNEI